MKCFLLFCILFVTGCVAGGTYNLSEKNDFFSPDNIDNNFTQGLSVSYREPIKEQYSEIAVTQELYTPTHKKLVPPLNTENPYAATLFMTGRRYNEFDDYRIVYSVDAGIVGKYAFGEQTQNKFHDLIGNKRVLGWDYQLPSEALVNFSYKREWINFRKQLKYFDLDSQSSIEARAGNFHVDSIFTNGFKLGKNLPKFDNSNDNLSYYLFSDLSNHFVAYNLYYDGTMFHDSPSVDTSHFVFVLDSGIGCDFKTKYFSPKLKFHFVVTTKEYQEQEEEVHSFGWLDLSFVF